METSASPFQETAPEAADEVVTPASHEAAPPRLIESHARIEALAAEIRAARSVAEDLALQHRGSPIYDPTTGPIGLAEPATAATSGIAPRIELPDLTMSGIVAAPPEAARSEEPARNPWRPKSLWRFADGRRRQLGAIAATVAAIGLIATAALHERSGQAQSLAAQNTEYESLAATLRSMKVRVEALETAKPRDDLGEVRRAIAEMKASVAGARDTAASVAQLAARFDKSQRDQDARIAKLTEKLDHDSAARNTEIVARLDKLEKKPAAVAAETSPTTVAPAPGPTTLAKQAALLPGSAPAISRETTGAIARPRPVLHDWFVSDIDGDTAMIDGRYGEREVSVGDMIPGAGRVERIERRGGDWAVVTNAGTIVREGAAPY